MTAKNTEIAELLDAIASLLEIEGDPGFRVRAYRNAADTIRFFDPPLSAMVAAGDDLTKLDDIGKGIAKKIEEIVGTGYEVFRDNLERSAPELGLLRIPGLGPKKAGVLKRELGVTSVEELEQAAATGRLRVLAGFGEKTEESLLRRIRKLREGASAEEDEGAGE